MLLCCCTLPLKPTVFAVVVFVVLAAMERVDVASGVQVLHPKLEAVVLEQGQGGGGNTHGSHGRLARA